VRREDAGATNEKKEETPEVDPLASPLKK